MKNPMIVIRRFVRKSTTPNGPMTISGGFRDQRHMAPRLRNIVHKIKRFFGLITVSVCVSWIAK